MISAKHGHLKAVENIKKYYMDFEKSGIESDIKKETSCGFKVNS